jgi:hypothetical protein
LDCQKTKRRALSKTERLAAALLQIKRGSEWLIPEPLRSSGDAAAICKHVEWDHKFIKAWGGDESPQNIARANRLTKTQQSIERRAT